jgi:hypothetical protein
MNKNQFCPLKNMQAKKKYFMNQLVILVRIYPKFGLTKIHYIDDTKEFIIDSELLTEEPIIEHTIGLNLLGGNGL